MSDKQQQQIALPDNIINEIIISNPNKVVSMYDKFFNDRKVKKRKYNSSITFFKYSSWFKYFISSNCDSTLDELQIYFQILNKYFKTENTPENTHDLVTYIENKLDDYNSVSPLLNEQYTSRDNFFKLWVILYNIGFFDSNNSNPLKRSIIENPNVNSYQSDQTNQPEDIPAYARSNSNITPLITILGDMGYSFIIAYDTMIDKIIGFEFGGSSAAEYDYYNMMLLRYIEKTDKKRKDYLEKYKNKKLKDYLELVKHINSCEFGCIFDMPFRKLDIFNQ